MNGTKKAFLLAGSILGIIEAASMILIAISLFSVVGSIDVNAVITLLEEEAMLYSDVELAAIAELTNTIIAIMSAYMAGMSVAMLVLSIIVLKQRNKGVSKKGTIIALLVISILNANILTAAFMIVALCLKDKTAQEIVEEHMVNNN